MQVNNVKNNQSFGMSIRPHKFSDLYEVEKYAFYKINQSIASKRGPKIVCGIKEAFENQNAIIGCFVNKKSYITHVCANRHITTEDLQALVDKFFASKNKLQKLFYNLYPKSKVRDATYHHLPYDTDDMVAKDGLQALIKIDNKKAEEFEKRREILDGLRKQRQQG